MEDDFHVRYYTLIHLLLKLVLHLFRHQKHYVEWFRKHHLVYKGRLLFLLQDYSLYSKSCHEHLCQLHRHVCGMAFHLW